MVPTRLQRTAKGDDPTPLDGWRVEIRQVLVVPTSQVAAFLLDPRVLHPALVGKLQTWESPSRGKVALAVAWACRYPVHLLSGNHHLAVATFRARKGRRMSTRFGSCYGGGS